MVPIIWKKGNRVHITGTSVLILPQRIESEAHTQQVKKMNKRLWPDRQIAAVASLGEESREYLQGMLDTNVPIRKNVTRILAPRDEYGAGAVVAAMQKAMAFNAYGADYIENILYQEMAPPKYHRPLLLKNNDLNRIALTGPAWQTTTRMF